MQDPTSDSLPEVAINADDTIRATPGIKLKRLFSKNAM